MFALFALLCLIAAVALIAGVSDEGARTTRTTGAGILGVGAALGLPLWVFGVTLMVYPDDVERACAEAFGRAGLQQSAEIVRSMVPPGLFCVPEDGGSAPILASSASDLLVSLGILLLIIAALACAIFLVLVIWRAAWQVQRKRSRTTCRHGGWGSGSSCRSSCWLRTVSSTLRVEPRVIGGDSSLSSRCGRSFSMTTLVVREGANSSRCSRATSLRRSMPLRSRRGEVPSVRTLSVNLAAPCNGHEHPRPASV